MLINLFGDAFCIFMIVAATLYVVLEHTYNLVLKAVGKAAMTNYSS